jgi:hypothetical protein
MNPMSKARGYGGAAIVVLTATVAWLMVQVPTLQDNADTSNATANQALTKVTEVEGQVNANAKALAEANARLVALGKTPVPVPPTPPPSAPVQTDEFTEAEAVAVRLIVADQIAQTPAKVTQAEINQIARVAAALVPKPKDGKTPTAAELKPAITAALDAFCAQDRCVGKPGTEGKQGTEGPAGKDAPEVTDEQLLAAAQQALAVYCAAESKPCQGPAGQPAPPPYSVVDTDCVGDGNDSVWKVYLSNGADQKTFTTSGPCRIGPDPN